jgi:2-dehydro-3-deoxyphosphogluconate aldolase/(4S)-4-hydroxy-2-oxoglutarate aldolase
MKRLEILNKLVNAGVIAVVRAQNTDSAIKTVDAVVKGGLKGIELTFTVPHADQVIAQLVEQYKDTDVVIGAGTVLDVISARLAILAGAQYIVSPTFDVETAKLANLYQIPYLPGTQTFTEIKKALEYGVDIVKLFPGAVAGIPTVKALKGPLPQANVMPTGGVSLDNIAEWFEAGVVAVGVGSELVGPALNGDYQTVTDNANAFANKLKEIQAK